MNENAAYTEAYLDTMADLDGDAEGRLAARAYLEQSTAVVHDEVVASAFVPRLFGRTTHDAFERIATTMHAVLCKVMARYGEDPAYRRLFSFDARLEELVLLPRATMPCCRSRAWTCSSTRTTARQASANSTPTGRRG